MIVPLGVLLHPARHPSAAAEQATGRQRTPGLRLGELPLARRDVERLRQILGLQRRMLDLGASPRGKRALAHRNMFREALTWLEIHGGAPEIVEGWKAILAETDASDPRAEGVDGEPPPFRRRRRRRRRGFRPAPQ